MRYVMLVCVDESVEPSEDDALPTAWLEEMEGRGVRRFGSRLRPVSDATTVQVRGGEVVYHLLPATRADLLRRLGRHAKAASGYREALKGATADAERRYLARRLAESEARSAT